jgi:hypothetical protein
VQTISRVDPKLIEAANFPFDMKGIFAKTEVQTFEYCLYIDDRNWNCGRLEHDMDALKMVNGDLYRNGKRLLKKHRMIGWL